MASTPARPPTDGRVTLEHIECNAACDYAPVIMVNWEFFDNQTPSSARDLVDSLRAGEPPVPSRGAPLCTFRETARILAGLPDDRPITADGQVPTATLAGLRVARELDMEAPPPDAEPAAPPPKSDGTKARGRRDHQRRTGTGPVGHRARRTGDHRNRPEQNGFTRLTWHLLLP